MLNWKRASKSAGGACFAQDAARVPLLALHQLAGLVIPLARDGFPQLRLRRGEVLLQEGLARFHHRGLLHRDRLLRRLLLHGLLDLGECLLRLRQVGPSPLDPALGLAQVIVQHVRPQPRLIGRGRQVHWLDLQLAQRQELRHARRQRRFLHRMLVVAADKEVRRARRGCNRTRAAGRPSHARLRWPGS